MEDLLTPKYIWINQFTEFEPILRQHGSVREYAHGEVLSGAGEVFPYAFYILSGLTKMSVLHEDGYEKTVYFGGQGSFNPLYSSPHKFKLEHDAICVTAITDVEALAIPQLEMMELMKENPALHLRVTDTYVQFVNLLLFDSVSQTRNDSLTKLANFLYVYELSMNASVIYLNQTEIAQAVGSTRTNIARALRVLRDAGIIETTRARLRITDSSRLRTFCSCDVLPD